MVLRLSQVHAFTSVEVTPADSSTEPFLCCFGTSTPAEDSKGLLPLKTGRVSPFPHFLSGISHSEEIGASPPSR